MKHPPKHRKTYGKSLRQIAKRIGVPYIKTKKTPRNREAGGANLTGHIKTR